MVQKGTENRGLGGLLAKGIFLPIGLCMGGLISILFFLFLPNMIPWMFSAKWAGLAGAQLYPQILCCVLLILGYLAMLAGMSFLLLRYSLPAAMRMASALSPRMAAQAGFVSLVCVGIPLVIGGMMILTEEVPGQVGGCLGDLALYYKGEAKVYYGVLKPDGMERMEFPYSSTQPDNFSLRWETTLYPHQGWRRGQEQYFYSAPELQQLWEQNPEAEYRIEYLPYSNTISGIAPADRWSLADQLADQDVFSHNASLREAPELLEWFQTDFLGQRSTFLEAITADQGAAAQYAATDLDGDDWPNREKRFASPDYFVTVGGGAAARTFAIQNLGKYYLSYTLPEELTAQAYTLDVLQSRTYYLRDLLAHPKDGGPDRLLRFDGKTGYLWDSSRPPQ